jgi:hypothetical protein
VINAMHEVEKRGVAIRPEVDLPVYRGGINISTGIRQTMDGVGITPDQKTITKQGKYGQDDDTPE